MQIQNLEELAGWCWTLTIQIQAQIQTQTQKQTQIQIIQLTNTIDYFRTEPHHRLVHDYDHNDVDHDNHGDVDRADDDKELFVQAIKDQLHSAEGLSIHGILQGDVRIAFSFSFILAISIYHLL